MANFDLQWRGREIKSQADRARKMIAAKSAFDIEAGTKANITRNNQVDTGFMRNSVYTVTAAGDTGGTKSGRYTSSKTGKVVKRETARPKSPRDSDAVVGVGALYAVWVERWRAFLMPAVDAVKSVLSQIARVEWRRNVKG
jgi:hypothetical protein